VSHQPDLIPRVRLLSGHCTARAAVSSRGTGRHSPRLP
jgi:hypothetical protein